MADQRLEECGADALILQRPGDPFALKFVFGVIDAGGNVECEHQRQPALRRGRSRETQCEAQRSSGRLHQWPVFPMLAQGSCGGRLSPFCSSSTEMLSGLRTKAI